MDGVILNVVTWSDMYYLDTWGRRQFMILGAVVMSICMLIVGMLSRTEGRPAYDPTLYKVNFDFANIVSAGTAVLALRYLYVASFAIS
ncbi:hypothetical protein LTR36_005151 [Oleoguttula mirabilis]|uniref:Uncharacterized protein n=1 Tax=Oleoguttula mirabilis TaxID=1507867 RepID=A0AAV9JYZ1_9PEZI|nr:hypothetical protein LTR36_005151 [Oleoguttula mirabilis]